jgi:hypothetical protein
MATVAEDEEDELVGLAAHLDVPSGAVDVPAFVNEHFPDEASLAAGLDPLILRLRDAIAGIDAQLAAKLRAHRHAGAASAARVDASLATADALAARLAALAPAAAAAGAAARAAIETAHPFSVALKNTGNTSAALDALVSLHDSVVRLEAAAHASALDAVAADPQLYPGIKAALATFGDIGAGEAAPGPGLSCGRGRVSPPRRCGGQSCPSCGCCRTRSRCRWRVTRRRRQSLTTPSPGCAPCALSRRRSAKTCGAR